MAPISLNNRRLGVGGTPECRNTKNLNLIDFRSGRDHDISIRSNFSCVMIGENAHLTTHFSNAHFNLWTCPACSRPTKRLFSTFLIATCVKTDRNVSQKFTHF